MSNPEEAPGVAADFDDIYYQKAHDRIEELLPGVKGLGLRRTWAATIDYTPDHLPILGPLITDDGPVEGTVVASPAGHGLMSASRCCLRSCRSWLGSATRLMGASWRSLRR